MRAAPDAMKATPRRAKTWWEGEAMGRAGREDRDDGGDGCPTPRAIPVAVWAAIVAGVLLLIAGGIAAAVVMSHVEKPKPPAPPPEYGMSVPVDCGGYMVVLTGVSNAGNDGSAWAIGVINTGKRVVWWSPVMARAEDEVGNVYERNRLAPARLESHAAIQPGGKTVDVWTSRPVVRNGKKIRLVVTLPDGKDVVFAVNPEDVGK